MIVVWDWIFGSNAKLLHKPITNYSIVFRILETFQNELGPPGPFQMILSQNDLAPELQKLNIALKQQK